MTGRILGFLFASFASAIGGPRGDDRAAARVASATDPACDSIPAYLRFQGELPRADGSLLLDRTTLSPLADGRVRQVIEQSNDGGRTWVVGFDAYYSRAGKP